VEEQLLEREQVVALGVEQAFDFYSDAFNLELITPPWLRFRVTTPGPIEMREGTVISYRLVLHGVPVRWRSRIESWEPPHRFVDRQLRGPYALWHHTHELEAQGERRTVVRDRVRYRIGFGPLGALANLVLVRRDLDRIFDYREQATARLMQGERRRPPRAA
jgi:ligand-binding SRPBCC domain-containing protein